MPATRRFPVRPCPVCASVRSAVLFQQSFERLAGASLLDGYEVVICADCGAGFADDIPPQPVFDAYYRDLSKYDDGDRSGEARPGSARRFTEIADTIVPWLPAKDARILEIGCGSGELLGVLRDRGYQNVLGVDPSPGCVRSALQHYGVPAVIGTILTVLQPGEPYDVLILIGVMEHIRDLEPAAEALRSLVRPEGRVYLEVPDASRYVPRLDAPFQEFSPEHINFFSRQSLVNLLQRRCFRAISAGHAVRVQNEVTCPTAWAVFEPGGDSPPIEPDRDTEAGLCRYIHGCREEDARIRDLIAHAVPRGERMIVWGVGTHTLRLLATHGLDPDRVALFVDSSPKHQGGELRGVPVVSPEVLRKHTEPILISSRGFQSEIHHQIKHTLQLANPVILLYDGANP